MNPHPPSLVTSRARPLLGFVSLVSITLLACLLASATNVQAQQQGWIVTGSLDTPRTGHTATLLANGKVLVVGGFNVTGIGSAELYDPATGTWSLTGDLNTARSGHSATLLPDGKVLVAGSYNNSALNSAELYDPATGTWSYTGNLNTAGGGTATLLPNGNVLVVWRSSAELYDPSSGMWRYTGSLNKAHDGGTATLLPNGKVLVLGGGSIDVRNSAELYDPATETWSITGNLNTGRWYAHTATLLPNGKVLVAAGSIGGDDVLESAELYDPVTGTWTDTGDLNIDRGVHTATLLPSGKVLVAGGFDYFYNSLDSAELYDPATGSWSVSGSLNTARSGHTATLLANGKVLVAAGDSGGSTTASAELFDSGDAPVPVVEYYNAALDHYFITWILAEQAFLDAGHTPTPWVRTGSTFNTYTSAHAGSAPVCRFYIPPAEGDSHFFGRDTVECNGTSQRYPEFILEDPQFMQMFLPAVGTCPANTTPIYRVFSNRSDANHRYMTDRAIRSQMVARGWVAEGDGPDLVVMCAPQ
ncbi:MAG TPA: kelch repeat-containing protein [Casimicrobiaceae bacterium]|jgi:N-acetylneuraminic acid mutarotase